jgi:Spy/CpxP family protein refolding chaperone
MDGWRIHPLDVVKKESMMSNRMARWSGLMAASLLALGAGAVVAQPGPGGHGRGHGHGITIEQVLVQLKGQLALDTSQQVMWDNAVAHTKAVREAGRGGMEQVRNALAAELAKPEPDFAAAAAVADSVRANQQAARNQVRDEWLKLYATFTPTQKAVVRDAVKQRLERMDSFRAKMKERKQARQGG